MAKLKSSEGMIFAYVLKIFNQCSAQNVTRQHTVGILNGNGGNGGNYDKLKSTGHQWKWRKLFQEATPFGFDPSDRNRADGRILSKSLSPRG